MKLIIGLGNPGQKYKDTRHNIGFKALDVLADDYNISMKRVKYQAFFGEGNIGGQKAILVKPQTYMNLSGESVQKFVSWYKIDPKEIIVLYDDITLEPGKLRLRRKGSAGGHNGIKNIIQHLNTQEFERVKIGIGQKPKEWVLADYVLSRFHDSEIKLVKESIKEAADAVVMVIEKDIEKAMNVYNSKSRR